jgi:hypothetical protein
MRERTERKVSPSPRKEVPAWASSGSGRRRSSSPLQPGGVAGDKKKRDGRIPSTSPWSQRCGATDIDGVQEEGTNIMGAWQGDGFIYNWVGTPRVIRRTTSVPIDLPQ